MGKNILYVISYTDFWKSRILNSTNILCISIIHQVSIQKYSHAIHIRYIYDWPCFKIRTDTFTYVVTRLINQLMLVLSRLPYTWSHIRLTVIHAHSWHPYFNGGSLLCVSDIYFMEIFLFCLLKYFYDTKTVHRIWVLFLLFSVLTYQRPKWIWRNIFFALLCFFFLKSSREISYARRVKGQT